MPDHNEPHLEAAAIVQHHLHDLSRGVGIFPVVSRYHDNFRAESFGLVQHHAGLDPEFPGFIAGREDYCSLLRTCDHDRLPFEVGVV